MDEVKTGSKQSATGADSNVTESIPEALKRLEEKVELLSAPYEDAMAHRVFMDAQERIKKWLTAWFALILVIAGVIGYKSFDELFRVLPQKVDAAVAAEVNVRVQKELGQALNDQLVPRLNAATAAAINTVNARTDVIIREAETNAQRAVQTRVQQALDHDLQSILDQTTADIQKFVNGRIVEAANQIGAEVNNRQLGASVQKVLADSTRADGWIYYGDRNRKTGKWTYKLFNKAGGDDQSEPRDGDVVIATDDINVRVGPPRQSSSNASKWENQPISGLVHNGDKLKIVELAPDRDPTDADASFWFRFVREK